MALECKGAAKLIFFSGKKMSASIEPANLRFLYFAFILATAAFAGAKLAGLLKRGMKIEVVGNHGDAPGSTRLIFF